MKALQDALINQLETKPIAKITVTDLCHIANINRSTFYAHYSDPADLLEKTERELIADITRFLESFTFADDAPAAQQTMTRVFEYIQNNAELCKVLLGPNGDVAIQKEIMMLMQRFRIEEWRASRSMDVETMDYILLYTINGSIGVVQRWVENGLNKPAREMADLLLMTTNRGLSAFG
jgi:AcrR family transcriptional regulator